MEYLDKWEPPVVIDRSDLIVYCDPAIPGSFHDYSSQGPGSRLLGILRQFKVVETILGNAKPGSTISVFQPPSGMHQYEYLGDGAFVLFLRKMTADEIDRINGLHNQDRKVPPQTWTLATERDQWMSCVGSETGSSGAGHRVWRCS